MKKKDNPFTNFRKHSYESNENDIWLTSTLSLARNFSSYRFPHKLEAEERKQIIELVREGLCHSTLLKKPYILRAEDASPIDKEFLLEHFLTPHIFTHAHLGEAFMIEETGEFLALINLREHVDLFLIDNQNNLEEGLKRLVTIESELGKSVEYAYDKKFGFLTSDPSLSGTGLQVHAYLQLPALIFSNALDQVSAKHSLHQIEFAGLQGGGQELSGAILSVTNRYTLGTTEEDIIKAIRTCVTSLAVEEKTARQKIRDEDSNEMKDRVGRAYGTLLHAYKAGAIEVLNELGLLKLALSLGWIEGITFAKLNELFFTTRRAHLFEVLGKEVGGDKLLHERAEYLHESLRETKLTF